MDQNLESTCQEQETRNQTLESTTPKKNSKTECAPYYYRLD